MFGQEWTRHDGSKTLVPSNRLATTFLSKPRRRDRTWRRGAPAAPCDIDGRQRQRPSKGRSPVALCGPSMSRMHCRLQPESQVQESFKEGRRHCRSPVAVPCLRYSLLARNAKASMTRGWRLAS